MVFGVETMRGCIRKETVTVCLLFQPQKLVSNHMLTIFFSMPCGCIFVVDTPTLILTARLCDLLMFPDYQVSLEKEEHIVFIVLTRDSKCSGDITTLYFYIPL